MIIQDIYDFFADLHLKYDPRDWRWDFRNGRPVPYLVLDNFLPDAIFNTAIQQVDSIPDHVWTSFTRNGSFMKECKYFPKSDVLTTLVHCFNSGRFLTWLEGITDIKKLIPDPHLIGAGLSRSGPGHSLKIHTDFNWNDELQLNRELSMILYLSDRWEPSWGGELEFWNFDRSQCMHKVAPLPNRLLLWGYDDRFAHGYPNPMSCPQEHPRTNLRLFYYSSNSTPINAPHRSLYWWDEENQMPFDDRTQK